MINLFDILNNSGYDFFFLVVDKQLDINLPQLNNFYSIYQSNLKVKNSGFLLSQPSTLAFIKKITAKSGHKVAIIPFKPSAKIDFICHRNHWLQISNPSAVNRLFEDKIKFYKLCQSNSLPVIPAVIDKFNLLSFQKAQQKFGQQIVVQTHFGWAGNCSYLSENFSEVEKRIDINTPVKYSKYLSGYSLINNCCLTVNGLIQSPVGLQYTDIPLLSPNPLATVGRQWPCLAPDDIQKTIRQVTLDFSRLLIKYKYRGFFGLDFQVADNAVYLLECNPRLTASFAFYTYMEIKNHLTPQFLYHIAEFIDSIPKINYPLKAKLIGSEITLKNSDGVTLKKYNDFTAFTATLNPISLKKEIIAKVL